MTSDKPSLNLVILGAGAVGKSAITIRMTHDRWQTEYNPTIEDNYQVTVEIDGIQENLDILDTAGQDQFAALQDHWIREAKGIMLVYTITSQRTLSHCSDLYKRIKRAKDDSYVGIVLVGNKSDLPATEREVKYDDGKYLSETWGVPFLETSAKTGDCVEEAFALLVKETKKHIKIEQPIEVHETGCNCCIL